MGLTYQACTHASNFNLSGPIDLIGLLILKILPRPALIGIILTGGKNPMQNDGLHMPNLPVLFTPNISILYILHRVLSVQN